MADAAPPGMEEAQPTFKHTTTMALASEGDDQTRQQVLASADIVAQAAAALAADGGAAPGAKEKKERGKDQQGGKKGKKGGGKGFEKGKGGKSKMSAPPNGPFGHGGLGFRLNVKNFSADTTAEDLKELFQPYGTVTGGEVKVREDGKSRGFGFVILQTEEEARQAIVAMNNKPINGKPLQVSPAERRADADFDDDPLSPFGKGKGKGKAGGKMPGVDPAVLSDPAVMQAAMFHQHMMMMQQAQLYNPYFNPYLGGSVDPMTGLPGVPGMPGAPGMPPLPGLPGMPGMPPFGLPGAPGMPPYPGLPGLSGMPPLPGAGDAEPFSSEYEGNLKSISAKNGYGFIACGQTYELYQRDIYVDKEMIPIGAKVQDRLRFTIAMNSKSHPKASSCRLAD